MRRAMGIAVFSGMVVTLFGIFLTPVFYALLRARHERRQLAAPAMTAHAAVEGKPGVSPRT